ncbi:ImmA/IrrE family metallo-endopeptidase [Dehalococcoides sp. UCH007]|uniref:ImmA/IrrE family metallo-endopeptidase n=1 Tax=Dehalococcoides sp. UCH007 TaxID=1522671 RepID=UPI00062DC964|nr:ImmA/IrrE family metallo-endopeptidase [Dehalococcoides sp. UCH007]
MKNPSDLRYFCYCLVHKYGSPESISEEQKAKEFRHYYLRDLPPTVKALRIVASCCGCNLDSSDKMPKNMRGFNQVVNGKSNIVIKDGDTVSGMQNTILHEIREIMEGIFPTVCRDYKPLKTSAKHYAANKFATAVLLPEETFTKKVYETGFDVIELASHYSKSCSQVLLRIGEVLQGKLFFYAGMYEPDTDNNWRVTYWTGSSNHNDSEANVYGLDGFFPRKNRSVTVGSLVEMTIKEGKSHMVEQISLLDEMEDEGLIAIANPLLIQNQPAKVILMVLLSHNRDLLSPQVEKMKPVIVERFHQHL